MRSISMQVEVKSSKMIMMHCCNRQRFQVVRNLQQVSISALVTFFEVYILRDV